MAISDLIQCLIEWQEERRMTNWELADLLDVSPSHISYLKSGRRQPGRQTLKTIWKNIPELRNDCHDFIFEEVYNATR